VGQVATAGTRLPVAAAVAGTPERPRHLSVGRMVVAGEVGFEPVHQPRVAVSPRTATVPRSTSRWAACHWPEGAAPFRDWLLRPPGRWVLVAALVDASVFLGEVEAPVGREVAVGVQGAELEDRLGAVEAPAGARDDESVANQVAAGALDHAGGDRPAAGQRGCAGMIKAASAGYRLRAPSARQAQLVMRTVPSTVDRWRAWPGSTLRWPMPSASVIGPMREQCLRPVDRLGRGLPSR
jgi:hypothetical protein